MKTTIDISDSLLREARRVAAREGVTLKILVERGLHRVITETRQGPRFKARNASFKDKGLQADLQDAPRETIRDLAYEGRS